MARFAGLNIVSVHKLVGAAAKVADPDASVVHNKDVLGLYVAMSVALGVDMFEPSSYLPQNVDYLRLSDAAVEGFREDLPESNVGEFHEYEPGLLFLFSCIDFDDIGMVAYNFLS